jgi:hypothetical protein
MMQVSHVVAGVAAGRNDGAMRIAIDEQVELSFRSNQPRAANLAARSIRASSIAFAMLLSVASLGFTQGTSTTRPPGKYSERVNATTRSLCAQIVAAIPERVAGRPGIGAIGNSGNVIHCDEQVPPALAAGWRIVGLDSTAIGYLMRASSQLRDRRLELALTETLRDSTRPSGVRQAAAAVLAHYVDSSLVGIIDLGLMTPDTSFVNIGMLGHPYIYDGAEPVDDGLRERVIKLFQSIPRRRKTQRLGELLNELLMMLHAVAR